MKYSMVTVIAVLAALLGGVIGWGVSMVQHQNEVQPYEQQVEEIQIQLQTAHDSVEQWKSYAKAWEEKYLSLEKKSDQAIANSESKNSSINDTSPDNAVTEVVKTKGRARLQEVSISLENFGWASVYRIVHLEGCVTSVKIRLYDDDGLPVLMKIESPYGGKIEYVDPPMKNGNVPTADGLQEIRFLKPGCPDSPSPMLAIITSKSLERDPIALFVYE